MKIELTPKELELVIDGMVYSQTGYANTPDKSRYNANWELIDRLRAIQAGKPAPASLEAIIDRKCEIRRELVDLERIQAGRTF